MLARRQGVLALEAHANEPGKSDIFKKYPNLAKIGHSQQFLTEALLLCFLGGIIGIVLGRGGSWVMRTVFGYPTEVSIPAIIASVAVSATVGVVFGFYPAWKASRLDPIQALRYE